MRQRWTPQPRREGFAVPASVLRDGEGRHRVRMRPFSQGRAALGRDRCHRERKA